MKDGSTIFIIYHLSFSVALLLLAACSSDEEELVQPQSGVLKLTTSVNAFDGEGVGSTGDAARITRTNIDGNAFANGDRIKLKIVCPYSPRTEFGETTYGYTIDALWLLKWNSSYWTNLVPKDSVDMAGTYEFKGSYDLFGRYEAQQTPYIYTASTWSDNVIFLSNGSMYSQYSYIFEANQTKKRNYLKSDLLWAQSYMQTGSYNVHLSFNHVMACLKIQITGGSLSANTVVTLEGMPDIDQREVIVGDYYAAKSKINSKYGYKEKCSCTKLQNGQVLGVAIIDDENKQAVVRPMTGNMKADGTPFVPAGGQVEGIDYVANNGVYTAYRDASGFFYLIVPPCVLSANPVFWIRDGDKRYSYTLQQTTFEQGKQYAVNISL